MKRHKYVFAVIYSLFITVFTVYALLDTFVIERVYEIPEQPETSYNELTAPAEETETQSQTDEESETEHREASVTNTSYDDGNISITITEYEYEGTVIYAADVILSSPEYLKTALARNTYGKNITDTTSSIASDNNAILAINGDFYGTQERGYVIRNGVLYRSSSKRGSEALVIYRDGSFDVISEDQISAADLLAAGAYNVFTFGPALVYDGEISVSVNSEVGRAKASNPRTAIGIVDELHYVFVVSDGRTSESEGLSLYELAEFMQDTLNVRTAYNLDGGGSSTMVFNGTVINNPTSGGNRIKERSVSDIVYIGY